MTKVTNYSSISINIDGVTIPSYGSALFNTITDYSTVNRLMAQHRISVTNAKAPVPDISVDTHIPDNVLVNVATENIGKEVSSTDIEEDSDTVSTIPTNKKRKSRNVDAEAEKSNLEKGDITDATD